MEVVVPTREGGFLAISSESQSLLVYLISAIVIDLYDRLTTVQHIGLDEIARCITPRAQKAMDILAMIFVLLIFFIFESLDELIGLCEKRGQKCIYIRQCALCLKVCNAVFERLGEATLCHLLGISKMQRIKHNTRLSPLSVINKTFGVID